MECRADGMHRAVCQQEIAMAHGTQTNELTAAVKIPAGDVQLEGDLIVPDGAHGLVIFAHGSGSSRFSGRNRFVAEQLRAAGLATLLMDLLTEPEEQVDQRTAHLRFDIGLLAGRVAAAAQMFDLDPRTMNLPIGLFGASTGGGAALEAAAARPELIHAVVSRGGRPDLADAALPLVTCPTLLIVGGDDRAVIGMNQRAMRAMTAPVRLEIVPGAKHLFEEPGALEQVAHLARDFFSRHLQSGGPKIILDGLDPPGARLH
jgi:pimeloyl-ACP methyl ester carboxylesterase